MNVAKLSTCLVAAILAAGGIAPNAFAQGKTRADVRQELVQAQHDGTIPSNKHDYPPGPQQVDRNKVLHGISVHGNEKAAGLDAHDGRLATR
ncbi:hypothetical protein WT67_05330 [Burkholderia stagnalis]|uniref:DUF4148 domain-containing protein n=1 Tax=Burkholderia stagnalis TaxID=1503054 RepID=A0A6L3N512_9BURK|nr:DUF4148 domain-containing protein [Burkholderia stagnalis]KAB0641197.1 DUF4148 domain-containing protein [Burkholderia stagnalis]KVO39703.1 hypothetical protein WT17_18655 [Burkholderia stagnalis]KVO64740.1 hypothetical protein WT19_31190 [Burkholderia stagnalis]KVW54633.1 hypothetical protein WT28_30865 [Burkholderia stagnalis]KVW78391.1 hypothetical protein WT29_17065 [Burkholderia stagnalis]